VYVGLHGFVESGPYGGMPAYDDIIQGLSGCAGLMERQSGRPLYYPTIAADKTSGLVAAHAILAALFKRERTGQGSYVEVPMLESMVAFNLVEHFYGLHFEPPLAPPGYPRLLNPFRKPFRTLDGYLCAMPYTDAHWKRFFIEAGDPRSPRTPASRTSRCAHRTSRHSMRSPNASSRHARPGSGLTSAPVSRSRLAHEPAGGPAGRPASEATGFFETIDDPAMGPVRFPGVPVKLDGERLPVTMPPRLGQHTGRSAG
jgi:crotonobetainyl-CoA:carnitine CoA-transferase CaiB-like acyl-CoA transferase